MMSFTDELRHVQKMGNGMACFFGVSKFEMYLDMMTLDDEMSDFT